MHCESITLPEGVVPFVPIAFLKFSKLKFRFRVFHKHAKKAKFRVGTAIIVERSNHKTAISDMDVISVAIVAVFCVDRFLKRKPANNEDADRAYVGHDND